MLQGNRIKMTVQFVGDSSFHFVSLPMTGIRRGVCNTPLLHTHNNIICTMLNRAYAIRPYECPSLVPQGGIPYKLYRYFDAVALIFLWNFTDLVNNVVLLCVLCIMSDELCNSDEQQYELTTKKQNKKNPHKKWIDFFVLLKHNFKTNKQLNHYEHPYISQKSGGNLRVCLDVFGDSICR